MAVRRVTTVSWFGRLANSVLGVGFGILLILGTTVGLFWHESRTARSQSALREGMRLVVSLPSGTIDPAYDGHLIHVTGSVTTDQPVSDEQFAMTAEGVRLIRSVEMFQWIETSQSRTRRNMGGGSTTTTSYSYATGWSDRHHSSSRFRDAAGHPNPEMMLESRSFSVDAAGFGAFSLGRDVLDRIGGAEAIPIPAAHAEALQGALHSIADVSVVDDTIYLGANPAQPELGDYRIRFALVPSGPISIIGQQRGNGIAAYGTRAGDPLLLVGTGTLPAQEMFATAAAGNGAFTWLLRIAGLVLLIAGFVLARRPLSAATRALPALRGIAGMGTGLAAIVTGIALGTLVIGLAWLLYRPLTAVMILAAGAALIVAVRWLAGRKRQAQNEAPT